MNAQADTDVLPILFIIGLVWWTICSVLNEIQSSNSKDRRERGAALSYNGLVAGVNVNGMEPAVSADVQRVQPDIARELVKFGVADASFDVSAFLNSSRIVYETIVMAFAAGDREVLQYLLAADVYDAFRKEIDGREARGDRHESELVCLQSADIEQASLVHGRAQIAVRFTSLFVTSTHDAGGNVIAGDPHSVVPMADLWTFSRDLRAASPVWKVVATDTP